MVSVYGSSIAPTAAGDIPGIRLNELAIWNTAGLVSANGNYVDWIELYNENNFAVDLEGWSLTDDILDPTKYTIPAGTVIGPQGFLIVFASADTSPPVGELHTGFALDEVNGGYVGLFAPGAATATAEVNYPAATEEDRSYSFFLDAKTTLTGGWEIAIISQNAASQRKKVWSLYVRAHPSIVNETASLLNPDVTVCQHNILDDTNYVVLSEWLPKVVNYANEIFSDDTGTTISSPLNSVCTTIAPDLTITNDVEIHAEIAFRNNGIASPINNMDTDWTNASQAFRTLATPSVTDESLIVISTFLVPSPNGVTPVMGSVWQTREKHIIVLSANTYNFQVRSKWHPQVFAHELGHYAGMWGHPSPDSGAPLDVEGRIMRVGLHPVSDNDEWWFRVSAIPIERLYFEGITYGSARARRLLPPPVAGFSRGALEKWFVDEEVQTASPW